MMSSAITKIYWPLADSPYFIIIHPILLPSGTHTAHFSHTLVFTFPPQYLPHQAWLPSHLTGSEVPHSVFPDPQVCPQDHHFAIYGWPELSVSLVPKYFKPKCTD